MSSSLGHLLLAAAARVPDRVALRRRQATWTYRDLLQGAADAGTRLREAGLAPGDRVALLYRNSPEYVAWLYGALAARLAVVPLNVQERASVLAHQVAHSGARLLAGDPDHPEWQALQQALPDTVARLAVPALEVEDSAARFRACLAAGGDEPLEAPAVSSDDLAILLYTSGTTGRPKGVMLSHGNIASNVAGVLDVLDLTQDDVALSFLPLCHAFERTVAYVCLTSGVSLIFAESIDTIARDLLVVRPTVMSGVPRVFEKLHARVLEKGRQTTGVKRAIFERAMAVADARGRQIAAGQPLSWSLKLQARVADSQVFSKIRQNLGGRLRWAVSGSAPLNPQIARFFLGVNLPILEGYGLTETAPVLAVTPPLGVRLGTVGPPLPNVEIRIADDGEILARGPNVMLGYLDRPDATAVVIKDGWFHTGDIGEIDPAGYVRITDRKKEVIVTSGGKKIAPQPIEERLRAHPLVNEAMLVGDGRHFPAVLLMPDFRLLGAQLKVTPDVARTRVDAPEVRALFQQIVDEANRSLAQFERIKKFVVLPAEFSVATGEMTPTLKIKRRVVVDRYRQIIDEIYA